MRELNIEQQLPEWFQEKVGRLSSTRMKQALSASYMDVIDVLLSEKGSGRIEDNFVSLDMQRGIDLEASVREIFELLHEITIEEVGLMLSTQFEDLCLPPDGFNTKRTIAIEIKCPKTKTHVEYIRQNSLPAEYKEQVLTYFIVCDTCEVVYFISYDDRFKPRPYHEIKITRSEVEQDIAEMKAKIRGFFNTLNKYKHVLS